MKKKQKTLNLVQSAQYSTLTFSHTTLSIDHIQIWLWYIKQLMIDNIYMPIHPKQQKKTINVIIHIQTYVYSVSLFISAMSLFNSSNAEV